MGETTNPAASRLYCGDSLGILRRYVKDESTAFSEAPRPEGQGRAGVLRGVT